MTLMQKIYINGKFLTHKPTGVHRVAEEHIKAIDELLFDYTLQNKIDVTLLLPNGARDDLNLKNIKIKKASFLSGFLKNIPWEQITLPFVSRNGLLLNFCNLGPILKPNAMTMIHDAQVYLTPESYSKGFALYYKFMLPLLGRVNKKILTVSNYSKQQLEKFGVADASKIDVIHNGIDHINNITEDTSALDKYDLEKGKYVISLSNSQAHKNIGILLKAFDDNRLGDFTLALFGGATKDDFEKLGFHVPENVKFLGKVSDGELVNLIKNARYYACPSTTEGFGLPPLEAMALGCPAICAPCGSLPEVCGDAALYAVANNAGEWVEAILSNNFANKEELNRQAGLFVWQQSAQKIINLIA